MEDHVLFPCDPCHPDGAFSLVQYISMYVSANDLGHNIYPHVDKQATLFLIKSDAWCAEDRVNLALLSGDPSAA